jgi:hypothetical protein
VTTDTFNSWKRWCAETSNKRVARMITIVPTHAAISDQVTTARCPPRNAHEEILLQAPRLPEMGESAWLLQRAQWMPRGAQ